MFLIGLLQHKLLFKIDQIALTILFLHRRHIVKTSQTRQSILCVTHQMSHKKRNYPVGSTVHYEMMNYKVIPWRSRGPKTPCILCILVWMPSLKRLFSNFYSKRLIHRQCLAKNEIHRTTFANPGNNFHKSM